MLHISKYFIFIISTLAISVAMAAEPLKSRGDGLEVITNTNPVAAHQKLLGKPVKGGSAIIRVDETAFQAGSGLITFSELALGTTNPVYTPIDYGGGAGDPTVTFEGYFTGQSLGSAVDCPPGAALSGCVIGSPTNPLSLDGGAPDTFIVNDASNPTTPVLSGSPTFNGPIAIMFDVDQAGVGLDGGYFDAIGGTAITAFDRQGNLLGSVNNEMAGIEFLGLVTNDGQASIAGLLFSLVGDEPAGFAIDNLRFGGAGQVGGPGAGSPQSVPSLQTWGLVTLILALSLSSMLIHRRRSLR